MNLKIESWKTILFWGSLWGILEATLGWGLHLIHFKGEAMVLYPFGLFCMINAMQRLQGGAKVVMQVAGVAALIKLVDLFLWPAVPAYWVINLAIAVFLEGSAFALFCYYDKQGISSIAIAFGLVLATFFVFRGFQTAMDALTTTNPDVHRGFSAFMMGTWVWKSFVQGLMIVLIYKYRNVLQLKFHALRWENSLAFPAFLIAVIVTLWVR